MRKSFARSVEGAGAGGRSELGGRLRVHPCPLELEAKGRKTIPPKGGRTFRKAYSVWSSEANDATRKAKYRARAIHHETKKNGGQGLGIRAAKKGNLNF